MAFCYSSVREPRRGHKALVPGFTGSNSAGWFMLLMCQADARLVSGSLLSWSLLAALMEHNKQQEFISREAVKSKV